MMMNEYGHYVVSTLIASSAATVGYLYYRLKRRQQEKPFDNLPMPGSGHLVYGHVPFLHPDFEKAQHWVAVSVANEQGRTGYWHTVKPGISLTHWKDVRQVLMAEEYRETLKVLDKHLKQFLGYNTLLVLFGSVWKQHRSAITKAFSPNRLVSYRSAMAQVVETFCVSLQQKIDSTVEGYYETLIEPLMKMITMDVFGLAAFSQDFGSSKTLNPSPFATAFDTLANGMTTRFNTNPLRPTNYFYSIPTEFNNQHKQAKGLLRTFLADEVRKRRANLDRPKDLLTYMVEAHDASKQANGETDMDEVLTDIMMTLLFAGYDTTSITLCYALYLISQNPAVEAKCLQEIEECSDLSSSDILQYCQAVVQEALRLYPAAPATLRVTRKDIVLHDGFVIPKGTTVFLPIWTIHRLEYNFSRASEFIPERWVQKGPDGKWQMRDPSDTSTSDVPPANSQAFFAFSGGARNCPGGRFAMQEATIVLAGMLRHLKFETLSDYQLVPDRIAVVQHPKDSLPMRISRRD